MNAQVKFLGSTVPQWTFADRIRKVRRDTGRTIEQMAVALEVGDKRYGAWEAGRNKPDDIADIAVKLERVTGVPRDWFLGWVSDSPEPHTPAGPQRAEHRPSDYSDDRLAPVVMLADRRRVA